MEPMRGKALFAARVPLCLRPGHLDETELTTLPLALDFCHLQTKEYWLITWV